MKKMLINIASHLVPRIVVQMALHQLNNPQVRKLRKHEEQVLQTAVQTRFRFKSFDIQHYHWAGSGPRVMLIHGWEGQAGNFADIIEKLREQDYEIIAFDGPSHGHSSKGSTSPVEFCELVGTLMDRHQPTHLVSHSFGGVPTTFALSQRPQLAIESYVLLTTPDRFMDRIDEISNQVGVSNGVRNRLVAKLRQDIGLPLESLNVSDFVQKANVKRSLILHDEADRIVPLAISERIQRNWPISRLEVVRGTGHYRILREEEVVKRVIAFLHQP